MAKGFRLSLVAPLLVFVGVTGGFLYALQSMEPSKLPSVLIGKPVPNFNLPPVQNLLDKGLPVPGFKHSDLVNGDVSIVNVWASWCEPCRTEHPHLVTLGKLSQAPIYGLNYKDKAANARYFLGAYGSPYKAVGADLNGRTAIDWGVYGVPETFIVDGKGRIAYKHVGPIDPSIISMKLMPVIQRIRNKKQ